MLATIGGRLATRATLLRAVAPIACRNHCQVPCGIFDDPQRVAALKEDAATIRKAMVQVNDLVKQGTPLSVNQVRQPLRPTLGSRCRDPERRSPYRVLRSAQATRWIMTKEDHAKSIITTVADYMLAQRVKKELFKDDAEYREALVAHHLLMQAAMKTKQVVDVAACDVLDHAIADVGVMYTVPGKPLAPKPK